MIILIDTDILIDVALDREPYSRNASEVINSIQDGRIKGFVAWHSLSNFYYSTSPVMNNMGCREFIRDLCQFVDIVPTDTKDMLYAVGLNMKDFEDAIQSAAAVACGADFIVTRNAKDYRNSPVPAVSPQKFLVS